MRKRYIKNMVTFLSKWGFIGIISLAFFLRVYSINSIPPSLFRDEVAIGYNAFSILTTGRDEHGRFLPLSFQAIGDWKLPLYIYSTIPFISFLGLSDVTPKLPAFFAGLLTVIIIYVLIEKLFKDRLFALITMFFLAISPWHIFVSRIAYEPTLSLFLLLSGVVVFIYGLERKRIFFLSFVFFGLTLLTYHGSQLFTPLFLAGLLFIYRKHLSYLKKEVILGISIFLIIAGITASATLLESNAIKISGIGFFSDKQMVYYKIDRKRNEHISSSFLKTVFHNKPVVYPQIVLQNYLKAFSPEFLFFSGAENPWQSMEEMGYFYLVDAFFMISGLGIALWKREKIFALFLLWLVVAPVAGSITKDAPGASRTLIVIVPLIVFTAYGVYSLITLLRGINRFLRLFILWSIALVYVISFFQFIDIYFVHFPFNRAAFYGYGYKQAVIAAEKLQPERVIAVGLHEYNYPYFLYYKQYSANLFRSQVKYSQLTYDNFIPVRQYGKYEFVEKIPWNDICGKRNIVVIDSSDLFPKDILADSLISLPNGDKRFSIWKSDGRPCPIEPSK